jgi:hypothetical protein
MRLSVPRWRGDCAKVPCGKKARAKRPKGHVGTISVVGLHNARGGGGVAKWRKPARSAARDSWWQALAHGITVGAEAVQWCAAMRGDSLVRNWRPVVGACYRAARGGLDGAPWRGTWAKRMRTGPFYRSRCTTHLSTWVRCGAAAELGVLRWSVPQAQRGATTRHHMKGMQGEILSIRRRRVLSWTGKVLGVSTRHTWAHQCIAPTRREARQLEA